MIAVVFQLLATWSLALQVNGPTFYSKVVDQQTGQLFGNKPAFVKFYAPWCGYCQAIAATWSKMADTYSEKVDFFEFDCTADDAGSICQEDFEVKGFPTLVYLPIEVELRSTYIQYDEEGLELEDLVSFAIDGAYKDRIENKKPIAKQLSAFESNAKKMRKLLAFVNSELDYWLGETGFPEEQLYWLKILWAFTLCVLAATPLFLCPMCIYLGYLKLKRRKLLWAAQERANRRKQE